MNREQAREIAERAWDMWDGNGKIEIEVADALHAAYEKDRAAPAGCQDSRLASIKETARRIWAAWNGVWESKDEPTILSESEFKFRSDGAVNMAEMLESAFERRYGAGGGNGNSGIWVKPGDLLDAAIKPQHGGKP